MSSVQDYGRITTLEGFIAQREGQHLEFKGKAAALEPSSALNAPGTPAEARIIAPGATAREAHASLDTPARARTLTAPPHPTPPAVP